LGFMNLFDNFEYIIQVTVSKFISFISQDRTVAFGNEISQATDGILDKVFIWLNTNIFKNISILMALTVALLSQLINIALRKPQYTICNDSKEQEILRWQLSIFFIEK